MELQKTAQLNLFRELAKSEIKAHQNPEYNGYGIDGFGYFQDKLNTLHEKFEIELNDNLTNRSPSLEVYLTDIIKTVSGIRAQIRSYQKEEIYDTQKETPEMFKINRLGYINHFLSFQLDMISRTQIELSKKLELVKNTDLFKPVTASSGVDGFPVLKNKIRSNLSRIDLGVLLWWLAETKFLEFDGSHDNFVKWVDANFQYYDKSKETYADMRHFGTLMAKLMDPKNPETNPAKNRKDLLEALTKQLLPPEKTVLEKRKPGIVA